jgi:hypothetical protein
MPLISEVGCGVQPLLERSVETQQAHFPPQIPRRSGWSDLVKCMPPAGAGVSTSKF